MKMIDEPLHKMRGGNKMVFSPSEQIVKWLVIFSAVVVFLLLLQILTFFEVFNFVEAKVRIFTGFDTFIVKGISFLLLALFFGTPFGGLVWSFLPFPQKNKKVKRFVFLAVLAVFCFIISFTSKDVYFNPEDGTPMKYYSVGPNGEYSISSSGGYDPVTGDKLQPINKETVVKHLKGRTDMYNTNNIGSIILNGAEQDSRFYPVEFENETGRNVYLCISLTENTDKSVFCQKILEGESAKLKLMEGRHTFGYMDVNGRCYGSREDGNILRKDGNTLKIIINKQPYYLQQTFSLDVLSSNNQTVTMMENLVRHNKELGLDEKIIALLIGFGTFSFLLLCFIFYGIFLTTRKFN